MELFWGDERHVPPDHPDSNFGMADRALVRQVPIPAGQVHRIRGELADPNQAAVEYARELPDTFDVMLLGLGEDGHIASIFPESALLQAWGEPCQARPRGPDKVRATKTAAVLTPKGWRITVTTTVILSSRTIVMLVSGANKAAAVAAAIGGALNVNRCPAQILRRPDDRVEWILDVAAASGLDDGCDDGPA